MAKKSRTPAPPRKVQAPQRRVDRRQPRSPEDRRTLWISIAFAASGLATIAVVVLVFALTNNNNGGGGKSGPAAGPAVDQSKLVGLQTGPAPWNTGLDHLPDRLKPLGLSALGAEGEVVHIHQHLDIFVNGKHEPVPALIGIYANQFLTQLHTHDASGIIHVESPTKRTFTLGDFFGVWGVRLTDKCIGGYCRPKTAWTMYVNGHPFTGNPSTLILKRHQEIVFAIGKRPKTIPSTYAFGGL
ncbi:MAG: hypothetical protein ACXVFC_08685 [Gaiellaceae bacterium]